MFVNTREIDCAVLDWAVTLAEGNPNGWCAMVVVRPMSYIFRPSTDGRAGGVIIEREKIATWWDSDAGCWKAAGVEWMNLPAESDEFDALPAPYEGPTQLVAAMRAYVGCKIGEQVDVPSQLVAAMRAYVAGHCGERIEIDGRLVGKSGE